MAATRGSAWHAPTTWGLAPEYRHYLDQLRGDGWRVVETDQPGSAVLTRQGVRVTVDVEPREGITLISVWADPAAD